MLYQMQHSTRCHNPLQTLVLLQYLLYRTRQSAGKKPRQQLVYTHAWNDAGDTIQALLQEQALLQDWDATLDVGFGQESAVRADRDLV